ncbi:MAG: choline-sulfatase [Microbacteriaceae bacterium]|nr:MAG: choline-sulfatase [Microbacteriaceae bacterium]
MSDSPGPPNILLVMCDQLSALATSPYGNADVITPNVEALAKRGTTFENAYCNAPLCAPSRASMMTGRLPDSIPVHDNFEELPASVPTFAHHLRRAGYRTILSGKMHFVGPDQLHGFEERLTTDIYPADLQGAQDWQTLGDPPRPPKAKTSGYYMAHMIAESGPVPWSAQLDYDEEVHFRALERIRQLSRRGDACDPWLMCVSYTQPHDPYAPAQEYWDMYDGRELALPDPAPAGYRETAWDTWVNAFQGVDIASPTPHDVSRARRAYYAMTTYIDQKLGELQAELRRFGALENTVVIFLSDHGDMMGEHGMFFKRTFREWSARIPLIFAGPGIAPNIRVTHTVSLVDLLPTLLGLAGLEKEPSAACDPCPGADILSAPGQQNEQGDQGTAIIEYSGNGTIAPTRTVVRGRHKYVYVHGEEELLFDLSVDPQEWNNLAQNPDRQELLGELREACMTGWSPDETLERVLMSQRVRIFLNESLSAGLYQPWDYEPVFDASRMHVRRPAGPIWDRSYSDQSNPVEGAR